MNVSPGRACVFGCDEASKNKAAACVLRECVCSRGARLGPELRAVRLALARLLSAHLIKLLTGLYHGAKGGNMLLPD